MRAPARIETRRTWCRYGGITCIENAFGGQTGDARKAVLPEDVLAGEE
jgi:hypothetical protein